MTRIKVIPGRSVADAVRLVSEDGAMELGRLTNGAHVEEIIRAVNTHDALVAALEAIRRECEGIESNAVCPLCCGEGKGSHKFDTFVPMCASWCSMEQGRAALKLASDS